MACRSVLLALAVLAAAAGAQGRELLAGAKSGGMMQQQGKKEKESYDAVFSRGRATSGDAYLAACAPVAGAERARWAVACDADASTARRRRRNTVQFDTPPAQVDADQFRNTIANFFKARPG
jgi:hypothetical protein